MSTLICTAAPQLIVVPEQSRKRPDEVVARIGKQLCFFEKGTVIPPIGEPASVMMTRPLYRREATGHINYKDMIAVLIRVVGPDDVLVEHRGFECYGTMCCTTASARYKGENRMLTPGRTQVWYADNVNASFDRRPPTPLRPGYVYVSLQEIERSGKARALGLVCIEDAEYAPLFRT